MTSAENHISFAVPTVETQRLRLRGAKLSDLEAYAAFRASERVRFMGGPNDRDEAFSDLCYGLGQWAMRGYGLWVVADKSTDEPLGYTGLYHPEYWADREISWAVFESAAGKGVATEAARAVRDFAYDRLGWDTVISAIIPGNEPSIALAKRLGATLDGKYEHPKIGEMLIYRHVTPESRT